MDLAGKTVELMKKIVPGIVEQSPDAVLMLVTNPVDVITQAALKISGLPDGQVIGSGTVLDSSRLRWLIAGECDVAISSVHAVICGEHGDSEVPMWSTASIGGVPLLEWEEQTGKLGRERRDVITRQTIDAAYEVIEGKGATNYAIGLAGSRIIEAILRDEHAVLPWPPGCMAGTASPTCACPCRASSAATACCARWSRRSTRWSCGACRPAPITSARSRAASASEFGGDQPPGRPGNPPAAQAWLGHQ